MQKRQDPQRTTATHRWTGTFLDELRQKGDPEADEALRLILRDDEAKAIGMLFARMDANNEIPPANLFPVLSTFFSATGRIPADVDIDRIHHGEDVFEAHAFSGALALLAKCLPEGYQAPNLSIILNISGDLRTHTYRRLLGTLQTVINVSTCRGFQESGRSVMTAQKLRLLHAAVRHLARRYRPDFEGRFGVPANLEDMLATALGFSLLVIEGWRTLKVGLSLDEEEDFLYLWLVFARMMGVHPPGEPESTAYVPDNVADASAFYRAYERRHYVDGDVNPDGVALAAANITTLRDLIPWELRFLGFGILPQVFMTELMGGDACRRLRIPVIRGHPFLIRLLLDVHRLLTLFSRSHVPDHERRGMIIFQDMIRRSYGGRITYTVPIDLAEMRSMVGRKVSTAMEEAPHA